MLLFNNKSTNIFSVPDSRTYTQTIYNLEMQTWVVIHRYIEFVCRFDFSCQIHLVKHFVCKNVFEIRNKRLSYYIIGEKETFLKSSSSFLCLILYFPIFTLLIMVLRSYFKFPNCIFRI